MRTVDVCYRHLRQRFPNLYTIGPQNVQDVFPVLAGGAVRDCFVGREPNDYDFWVKNDVELEELLAKFEGHTLLYDGLPRSVGYAQIVAAQKIRRVVKIQANRDGNYMNIDIIVRPYHTIRQIIYGFDYTINAGAFRIGYNEFTCHSYFFPDLHHGILRQVDDEVEIGEHREEAMISKGFRRLEEECLSETSETDPETSTNSSPTFQSPRQTSRYSPMPQWIPDEQNASSTQPIGGLGSSLAQPYAQGQSAQMGPPVDWSSFYTSATNAFSMPSTGLSIELGTASSTS